MSPKPPNPRATRQIYDLSGPQGLTVSGKLERGRKLETTLRSRRKKEKRKLEKLPSKVIVCKESERGEGEGRSMSLR